MSTDRHRRAAGAAGSSSARPVVVDDTPPMPHVVPSPPPDTDSSAIDPPFVPDTPVVPDTISPPPDSLPPLEPPTQPVDSSQPGAPSPSCERHTPHSSGNARAPLRNIENQPSLVPSRSPQTTSPPRKRARVEPSEVQQLSDIVTAALQRMTDVQTTQHRELVSQIREQMERDYARSREAEARHLAQMRQLIDAIHRTSLDLDHFLIDT